MTCFVFFYTYSGRKTPFCPLCLVSIKTKLGDNSTSGTTISCAIIHRDILYITNVGDFTVVLGKANPKYEELAEVITRNHKPEDEKQKEKNQITWW